MSASDPNSKIDLLDKPDVVKSKLKKAVCAPQEVEGNGVLSFVEFVLFPIAQLGGKSTFHVPRPEKYGGPVDYSSFEELKAAYADGTVLPLWISRPW
jgi:tyrosyl-tRNA synthetase